MEGVISSVNASLNIDAINQDPSNLFYLEMDSEYTFPSRVTMTYLGEIREILPYRMAAISTWLRSPRPSMSERDVLAIFRYEGRFTDGSVSYWLPVQTTLIQSMQDELKGGDRVALYLRWIALAKVDNGLDYIFLVNAWYGPY
jgi:hypothetical protein